MVALVEVDGVEVDADEVEADLCRASFVDFVKRFWDEVEPETLRWNWHMDAICDALQEVAEGVFKRAKRRHDVLINIPPGTSKTLIASVLFPAWCWTRMPECRTIAASYAHDLALASARKHRDLVLGDKWQRLFGDVGLRDDQRAKGYFVNSAGGDRYSVGTNGGVTGFHGHFIIIDDPLDPRRAASVADLAAANRWISETLPLRAVDKSVTVKIQIMQRLHQQDPSAVMIADNAKAPIRHLCLPGEIFGNGYDQVKPRKYARRYREGLLDPDRMSRAELVRLLGILKTYGYAGQILQNPVPRGGGKFKTQKIKIGDPPPLSHFKYLVRYWDKAATEEGEGAQTAGVLLGEMPDGSLWILHVIADRWDSGEREKEILQTAQSDAARAGAGQRVEVGVEQEPGSGGKESAQSTVRNLAGFVVHVDRPTGNKVVRADPISSQINSGNVSMARGDWNEGMIEELRHFPRGRLKDRVDALSGAFTVMTRPRVEAGGLW